MQASSAESALQTACHYSIQWCVPTLCVPMVMLLDEVISVAQAAAVLALHYVEHPTKLAFGCVPRDALPQW
jgi:hypothetical protein